MTHTPLTPTPEEITDARLKAAAPDLLAALEQMLADHDELTALRARCGHPPALAIRTLDAARAAIAKAKCE